MEANNCAADATCEETTGSFTCACNDGYHGLGTDCYDTDECSPFSMSDCNGFNFTEARCKMLLYETSNHRDNSSRFCLALVQYLGGDTSCDNDPRGRGALPALNCVQFDYDNGGCGSSICIDTPYAHVQDSDGNNTCNAQATCGKHCWRSCAEGFDNSRCGGRPRPQSRTTIYRASRWSGQTAGRPS